MASKSKSSNVFQKIKNDTTKKTFPVLDDQPAQKDFLDFDSYAQAILDLLIHENTRTPLTVGIFGRWGMGKTTLLQMLEKELSGQGLVTIWFNAWQYSHEDELWAAFLQSMLNKIQNSLGTFQLPTFKTRLFFLRVKWNEVPKYLIGLVLRVLVVIIPLLIIDPISQQLRPEVQPYLKAGGRVAAFVLAIWIVVKPLVEAVRQNIDINISDFQKTSNYQEHIAFLDRFKEHFTSIVKSLPQKGDKKLAVFIDDLDRCSPEQTIRVLDAIKLFVDVPGCLYILGLDVDVVQKAVAAKYVNDPVAQREYMSKIIQIPFQLPLMTRVEMGNFLGQLEVNLPDRICNEVFISGLVVNPREVKRTINIFTLLWNLATKRQELTNKITPVRLAKIVVIQQGFPELHRILQQNPNLLVKLEQYFRATSLISQEYSEKSDSQRQEYLSEMESKLPEVLQLYSKDDALRNMLLIPDLIGSNLFEWPYDEYDFYNLTKEDVSIYFTLTNRASSSREPDMQRDEEHLYTELVILVQGDSDVADRLIEQQERLFPGENRRKWIERARDKLLYDRGAFTP